MAGRALRHIPALCIALCVALATGTASAASAKSGKSDPPMLKPPSAETIDPARFGVAPDDLAFGAFQRGLYLTAFDLALPRAKAGDKAAQTLVAQIYARGLGVPRDDKQAAHWYGLAAEQGVPEAQLRYALYLLDGSVVPPDHEKGRQLMKAAAEAGNALAEFNYAQMLASDLPGAGGPDDALPWYLKAARAGIPDAEYAVSRIYASGSLTVVADLAKARIWLTKAAQHNFAQAQLDLGTALVDGRGGPRDEKEGFEWLLRAARAGNVPAEAYIARLYRAGIGVDADLVSAAAWYIVAREAGLKDIELDEFMDGLTDEQVNQAQDMASKLAVRQ